MKKVKRIYKTKEESKNLKRTKHQSARAVALGKQRQKQKQQQIVNVKIGSSRDKPQPPSIPTVISNTQYIPQPNPNSENLLLQLMTALKDNKQNTYIPETFRNMAGENVPLDNLVRQTARADRPPKLPKPPKSLKPEKSLVEPEGFLEPLKPPKSLKVLEDDEETQYQKVRRKELLKKHYDEMDKLKKQAESNLPSNFKENQKGEDVPLIPLTAVATGIPESSNRLYPIFEKARPESVASAIPIERPLEDQTNTELKASLLSLFNDNKQMKAFIKNNKSNYNNKSISTMGKEELIQAYKDRQNTLK